MKIIEYISNNAILIFLLITILFGIKENKNILNLFISGVIEGVKIVYELFPILLALIVAVQMFNESGIIDYLSDVLYPIFKILRIDKGLIPLILVRPISGSTTTAIATNIMKNFGVDSKLGIISSCIMGATETTIYVATLYSSKVKVKNITEVICIGLITDFIGILCSILAFNLGIMRIL